MECWEETKPLVETLVTEVFPIGPVTSMALNDESQYDLNVHLVTGEYQERFREVLLDQFLDSGEYSMREFTKQLSKEYKRFRKVTKADDVLPSEAIMRFRFDRTSPTAEAYAVKSSASMVTDLADTNIAGVRSLVGRAFQEQRTYQQTATALTALLSEAVPLNSVSQRLGSVYGINANGLFPRYANAVANFAEQTALDLTERGITGSKALKIVQQRSDKYANKLRRSRAKMIARTEIMRANNAGRLHASDQASAKGLFDRDKAQRQWITAPQDACYICGPLNGVAIPYNESWYEGEPAFVHPNCRCTWLLIPNVPVFGVPTVSGDGTASNPFLWNFANQQNQSLAGIQTGGATASGAPDTIPDPKPMQSTTVTDEVVEVADEVVPVATDPTDELMGYSDIDEFVEKFVWDDAGRTWGDLDTEEWNYLGDLMIDTEIRKAIDQIDDFSAFVFDEQGYTLMANAPREVAEEILELQREIFEKTQAVERSRKIQTLQVQQTARATNTFTEGVPELDYFVDFGGRKLSGRTIKLDTDNFAERILQRQMYSGKEINWQSVNRRLRVWSELAEESATSVADEAVEAITKLGNAMEREVQRRIDEIVGSGASREQVTEARQKLQSELTQLKNKYGKKLEGEWWERGTQTIVLPTDTVKILERVQFAKLPNDVNYTEISELFPYADIKAGTEVQELFRTGRRALSDEKLSLQNWDDLLLAISNQEAVPIEVLTDIVDMMDQLIIINNSTRQPFLSSQVLQTYDSAINTMLNKIDDMYTSSTGFGANNQILQSPKPRSGARDFGDYKKEVSKTIREDKEVLNVIAELDSSLATQVKAESIDTLEGLIDDWIALEEALPPNLDETAKYLLDELPLDSNRGASNELLDVAGRKQGMKQRLQQLRELIAESETYPVGSAERIAFQSGHRDIFLDMVSEFTERHAISGRYLRSGSKGIAEANQGVRQWSLRGNGVNSAKRVDDALEKIAKDFNDQLTDEAWEVLTVLGDDGKAVVDPRVAEVIRERARVTGNSRLKITLDKIIDGNEPALGSQYQERLGFDPYQKRVSEYRVIITEQMKGDIKTLDGAYESMDLLVAENIVKKDLKEFLESVRTDNLGGGASLSQKAERGAIRQLVLQEARDTGGDTIQFGKGLEQSSRVKATGKTSPSAGKELKYTIRDPKTGEILARKGDKVTPDQYHEFAQMMADESTSYVPTVWTQRLKATTTLDQADKIDNVVAGYRDAGGNRAFYGKKTDEWLMNSDKYTRDGFTFTTSSKAPTRAHASTFERGFDAQYAKGYDWTQQMDDIPDTILMVSQDINMRGGHVNITYNNLNQTTMGHELQHLYQNQNGTFGSLERAWYRRRVGYTADPSRATDPAYKKQGLYDGNSKEKTIPDMMQEKYATKFYEDYGYDYYADVSPVWANTGIVAPTKIGDARIGTDEWFQWHANYEGLAMSFQDLMDKATYSGKNGVIRSENIPRITTHFDEAGKRLSTPILGEADEDYIGFYYGMYGGI